MPYVFNFDNGSGPLLAGPTALLAYHGHAGTNNICILAYNYCVHVLAHNYH